jgi:hypothetical protein
MKEIKSVRVRKVLDNLGSQFDIKVTLYKDDSKRILIGLLNGSKLWNDISYSNIGRYSNYTNDQLIDDFIDINSKREKASYEIIQDPWLDKPPKERSFGYDPYYLNNGAIIEIKWFNENLGIGGKSWSDLEGNELNIQKGMTQSGKDFISKTAKVLAPKSYLGQNKTLYHTNSGLITDSGQQTYFSGLVKDLDIINQIINQWQVKIPNYNDLNLCEPNNEFCELIDFINPADELIESNAKSDNLFSSEDPIADRKIELIVDIDTTLSIKPREDFNIKIFIGKSPDSILNGFDFGDLEADTSLLDDEFIEEESVIVDGEKIILFDNSELSRDSGVEEDSGVVETGGNSVLSPNSQVTTNIVLTPDLKSVRNSSILTKQSTGKGYRDINNDVKSTDGKVIKGSDIVRNMNTFIIDVLGPFASYLKSKYPSLYKDWYITSSVRGYIPKGGSLTSQHLLGQAIDSQILGSRASSPQRNIDLLNAILEWYKLNPLGYGQILFETRGESCWIHWSYTRGNTKLHFARFKDDRTLIGASANTLGKYLSPSVTQSLLGFGNVA